MYKKSNKFFKFSNTLLNKKEKYRGYILTADREREDNAFLSGILVAAFADKFKLKKILITDYNNSKSIEIYKNLGFENFHFGFSLKKIFNLKAKIISKAFVYFFYSAIKITCLNFKYLIKKYKVLNVPVGDLIYDQYNRHDLSFKNPKFNFKFFKILFKCILSVYNIDSLIKKCKIKLIIANTDSYVNNNSILLRVGVCRKIKCNITSGFSYLINLSPYKFSNIKLGTENLGNLGITKKDINNLKISKDNLNKFINLRSQFKEKTNRSSILDLVNANSAMTVDRQLLFNKLKIKKCFDKIILIAPHAFSDAVYPQGTNFFFSDYYDQFVQTLNFIRSKHFEKILWLVRPHPASARYNEDYVVKNVLEKIDVDFNNIYYCPREIAQTNDLINICDHVITGRGTIGIEFACNGKIPLLAGSSVYSGFGISLDPKSKKQYFNYLKKITLIKSLSKSKILLAKKLLYYLEHKYPCAPNEDMKIVKKYSKICNDQITNKIENKKLFYSKIIENLRKYDIKNDELYKAHYNFLEMK